MSYESKSITISEYPNLVCYISDTNNRDCYIKIEELDDIKAVIDSLTSLLYHRAIQQAKENK